MKDSWSFVLYGWIKSHGTMHHQGPTRRHAADNTYTHTVCKTKTCTLSSAWNWGWRWNAALKNGLHILKYAVHISPIQFCNFTMLNCGGEFIRKGANLCIADTDKTICENSDIPHTQCCRRCAISGHITTESGWINRVTQIHLTSCAHYNMKVTPCGYERPGSGFSACRVKLPPPHCATLHSFTANMQKSSLFSK